VDIHRQCLLQVPDAQRDELKAQTDYPLLVLYDVRLAITLVL
jgi:hypothetical protein